MGILNYSQDLGTQNIGRNTMNAASQMQGLQQNAMALQDMREQRQQQQQAQQQQQQAQEQMPAKLKEATDIMLGNDFNAQAAYMLNNPDIREQFIGAMKFKDESAIKENTAFKKQILSSVADPKAAIESRIKTVDARGGDTENLEALRDLGSIEEIKSEVRKELNIQDPEGMIKYNEASKSEDPEKGTFTIKETPSGFIKLNSATGQITEIASDSKIAKAQSDKERAELKAELDSSETTFKRSNTIRNRYDKKSGAFEKVRDAYSRIQASSEKPDAAGDLALVFNFMKMLDPGSTVMEGEFKTAAGAASVPERFMGAYNKVSKGQVLGDLQRKEFVNRAKKLMSVSQKQQVKDKADAISLGAQYGVTENDLFGSPLTRPENVDIVEQLKAAGQTEEQINAALEL